MRRPETGFTLIELLIVVLIIGILASIAVPKFANGRERAYMATMKGDLRNLAVSQEAYFYDNALYYDGALPNPDFTHDPSPGVTLILQDVTPGGWAAVATHIALAKKCTIYLGVAPPLPPATDSGEPMCEL
jgi:prepilin-type N-terminal cleavage/methylation domain-containing protein